MASANNTSLPNETWRPVVGYEGYYEVSDHGRVRSVERTVTTSAGVHRRLLGKIIKPFPEHSGHLAVNLYQGENKRRGRVHRMVLEAFVGPCPQGQEVLHLNDLPEDNRLENMRYGSRSENLYDAVRNGRHRAANKVHCKRGHLLDGPNLVTCTAKKGFRNCRACGRAAGVVAYAKKTGRIVPDMQEVSDEKYAKIMGFDRN